MKHADIDEADVNVSTLVDHLAAGEEIVIARSGKPVARLIQYGEPKGERRRGGVWRGRVRLSDDFDAPLL